MNHFATNAREFQTLQRSWLVACAVRELSKQPIARTILGTPMVLFQDRQRVAALLDRCPHRNAPLSAGTIIDGRVQCPYHGWQFDATGACTVRPGVTGACEMSSPVTSFQTIVQHGLVWVRVTDSAAGKPPSRPWNDDDGFRHFLWVDAVDASFGDALENLLDGTHTPFVHSGLVRSQSAPQEFSAMVRIREGIAEAEYLNEGQQSGWISRIFERNRASSFGRFVPPCIAELEYTSRRGTEFVLNSHFTPESPGRMRVYSTIFLRRSFIPFFAKRLLITPFFKGVLKQDQRILKLQQDNLQRFGGPQYQSWEGDLLRGWIDTWLRTGELPESEADRQIDFQL